MSLADVWEKTTPGEQGACVKMRQENAFRVVNGKEHAGRWSGMKGEKERRR